MSRTTGKQTDIQPVEEWERMLLMPQLPEHWQVVYELLWQTGVRISEALSLKRTDVADGGVYINRKKRDDKRRDFIPVNAALYQSLQQIVTTKKQVRLFPYTAAAAWAALKLAARKAGVRETIHPHCFRHAMGYRIMRETKGNLIMVKEILGHKSLNSAQHYVNPPKREIEDTIRRING